MKGNEGQTRKPAGALKKALAFGCAAAMVLAFAPTAAFAALGQAAEGALAGATASLAADPEEWAAEKGEQTLTVKLNGVEVEATEASGSTAAAPAYEAGAVMGVGGTLTVTASSAAANEFSAAGAIDGELGTGSATYLDWPSEKTARSFNAGVALKGAAKGKGTLVLTAAEATKTVTADPDGDGTSSQYTITTPEVTLTLEVEVKDAPKVPVAIADLSYMGEDGLDLIKTGTDASNHAVTSYAKDCGYTIANAEDAAKQATIEADKNDAGTISVKGVDAGSYKLVATLDPGFVWADTDASGADTTLKKTTTAATISPVVAKAAASAITLTTSETPADPDNLTVYMGEVLTFDLVGTVDGGSAVTGVNVSTALVDSATGVKASANGSKVTLDASGTTVTAKSDNELKVTVDGTDNYEALTGSIMFDIADEANTLTLDDVDLDTDVMTYEYTGGEQVLATEARGYTVTATANLTVEGALPGEKDGVKYAYAVDAGTYNVRITPAKGWKWDESIKVDANGVYSTNTQDETAVKPNQAVNFTFDIKKAEVMVGVAEVPADNTKKLDDLSYSTGTVTLDPFKYGKTGEFAVMTATEVDTSDTTVIDSGTKVSGVDCNVTSLDTSVATVAKTESGTYEVSSVKPGTTSIVVTVPTASNSNFAPAGSNNSVTVSVTVNPLDKVAVPTLSAGASALTYSLDAKGNAEKKVGTTKVAAGAHCTIAGKSATAGEVEYAAAAIGAEANGKIIAAGEDSYAYGVNAGWYRAVATLDEGYAWTTGDSSIDTADKVLNFEVKKGDITLKAVDSKGADQAADGAAGISVKYGTPAKLAVSAVTEVDGGKTIAVPGVTVAKKELVSGDAGYTANPAIDSTYEDGMLTFAVNDTFNGSQATAESTVLKASTEDGNWNSEEVTVKAAPAKGDIELTLDGSDTINMLASKSETELATASVGLAVSPSAATVTAKIAKNDVDSSTNTTPLLTAAIKDGKLVVTANVYAAAAAGEAGVTLTPAISDTTLASRYNSATVTTVTVKVTPLSLVNGDDEACAGEIDAAVAKLVEAGAVDSITGDTYAAMSKAYETATTATTAAYTKYGINATDTTVAALAADSLATLSKYSDKLAKQNTDDVSAADKIYVKLAGISNVAGSYTDDATVLGYRADVDAANAHVQSIVKSKAEPTTAVKVTGFDTYKAAYDNLATAEARIASAAAADIADLGVKSASDISSDNVKAVTDALKAYDGLSSATKSQLTYDQIKAIEAVQAALDQYMESQTDEGKAVDAVAALADLAADGTATVDEANAEAVKAAVEAFDNDVPADAKVAKSVSDKYAAYKTALAAYADAHELTGGAVAFAPAGATYTGADVTPAVTVTSKTGAEVPAGGYDAAWTDAAGNAVEALTAAGTYKLTVTAKGAYTGGLEASYTVGEGTLSLAFKNVAKTYKGKKLVKKKKLAKKQSFAAAATASNGAAVSYKVTKSAKGVTFKNGKVTVKKGTKKGTYKVKVTATATLAGFTTATKSATITVKVK